MDSNNEDCGLGFFLSNCVLLTYYTNYGVIVISQAKWSCDGAFVLNMMVCRIFFSMH